MCLVHREQRHARMGCKLLEHGIGQTLRRHIHEVIPTSSGATQHLWAHARLERGVEIRPSDAHLLERAHLVVHERDERRNHQRKPVEENCGHLVADGLAGAGGHDRKRVTPCEDCLYHALLTGSKIRIAKTVRQHRARIIERRASRTKCRLFCRSTHHFPAFHTSASNRQSTILALARDTIRRRGTNCGVRMNGRRRRAA